MAQLRYTLPAHDPTYVITVKWDDGFLWSVTEGCPGPGIPVEDSGIVDDLADLKPAIRGYVSDWGRAQRVFELLARDYLNDKRRHVDEILKSFAA